MRGSGILVRPAQATGPMLLLLFGFALFALSLVAIDGFLRGIQPVETLFYCIPGVVLGLLLCVASARWWLHELSQRSWLTITPEGFNLLHRDFVTQVTDDQVLSTSTTLKPFSFNGSVWSNTRTLNIWLAGTAEDHAKLTLVCKTKPEAGDPLVRLIERLNAKLATQAKIEREGGQVVYGEGWALDQQTLRITPARKEAIEIPVTSLQAIEVLNEELCIWSEDRDEPVAKIPIQAANAYILYGLLADALRAKKTQPIAPESGLLGRMIFEKRPTYGEYLFYLTLGIFFLGILSPCLFLNDPNPKTYFLVFGSILAGLLFFAGVYNTKIAFFRYHEFGIHRKTIFSERKLRFSDLDAFTFIAVRQYFDGVYGAIVYQMTFDPVPEQLSEPLVYRRRLRADDLEIEKLRDGVSRFLAARMIAKVNQGEKIPWTKNTWLLPEGLEFETFSLLLQRQKTLLPYKDIANYEFREGSFYLFSSKSSSAVFKMSTWERNFFPGFVALDNLRTSQPIVP